MGSSYRHRLLPWCLLVLLIAAGPVYGQEHNTPPPAQAALNEQPPPELPSPELPPEGTDTAVHSTGGNAAETDTQVTVIEHLGDQVPLDLVFRDEEGRSLSLGELLGKPTVVLPIYYTCPTACPIMLGNLAATINEVPLELGKDYRVLAVSFNDADGPEQAAEAKENYGGIVTAEAAADEWRFLTADEATVKAFTGAIGFGFKKLNEHQFLHPNVMVVLAPDGTIIRYLYGPRFLPFDVGMAVTEAQAGTPSLSVRRLLTVCFSYEPSKRTYVFRSFRLVAAAIIITLAAFFILFLRKKPRDAEDDAAASAGEQ